jgi:hypothetical protein
MDNEMAEFEVNFITNMPAGSTGILTTIPFPGWEEPKPITKKNLEEAFNSMMARKIIKQISRMP